MGWLVSKKKKSTTRPKKGPQKLPVKYGFPYLPAADAGIKHYMRNVSHYPILTQEEEETLIESFRKNKNKESVRKLIQSNLRLVVKIALEYNHATQNLMDLIQEGNIGLMKAVQKYDPKHGARLGYYASWWIKSYILKYIMDNFRLVKVGTTQAQKKLFFNLVREKQRIDALGYGAQDSRKMLSEHFEMPEEKIDEMSVRLSHSEASLDAPIGSQKDDSQNLYLIDMIEDKNPTPLDDVLTKEKQEVLVSRLKEFSEGLGHKEQMILKKRLLAEVPKTLQELGEEFGVTKERVRQLQNRLIGQLKESLQDLGADFKIDD